MVALLAAFFLPLLLALWAAFYWGLSALRPRPWAELSARAEMFQAPSRPADPV